MPTADVADAAAVEQTFRQEFGRAVANLVRLFGDIDLAEEAVQEAFVAAVQRWGEDPLPGAERRRAPRPPPARAGRRLPRLQRGLHRDRRRRAGAVPPLRRGDTPGPPLGRADARRAGGARAPCPPAAHPGPADAAHRGRRVARAAARPGPVTLGPGPHRRGAGLVAACIRRNRPGPYQIQAAINAVHADARTASDTNWRQILERYDQLFALAPTPVVALNRAVAVAEVHGPAAALDAVDGLDLVGYHLFQATRADLLRRLGRHREAVEAYDAALALTANAVERRFLEGRRRALTAR